MSEFVAKCGAEREIGFDSSFSADPSGDDWFIVQVDGKRVLNRQYIGCGLQSRNKANFIGQCQRCVGQPDRVCDLDTSTWSNLEPQDENKNKK